MRRDDLAAALRDCLARLPPPHQAHYGVVMPPPPREGIAILPVSARHHEAMLALARLGGGQAERFVVSRVLARQEAVSSSAVEGTHSTLDELLTVEETEDAESAGEAAHQVRHYALSLERALPRARAEGPALFTEALLAELHRGVMAADPAYPDPPGALRRVVVWIGGGDIAYSTWNPPPPAAVPGCLAESLRYLREAGEGPQAQSLLTRMAISHAHFEAVHPFRDGNGRVGRLLLPLMMAAEGQPALYLSPFIEARRAEYFAALRAAQQRQEWHVLVGFLAEAVLASLAEAAATAAALQRLAATWRRRRRFRQGSAALRALAVLPDYPVLTVRRLGALLGVSFPAANGAIETLVEAGILTERTGHARNRLFAAPEALRVINRPFGAAPLLD